MVAANAYENYKHGKGLLNDITGLFHSSAPGASSPGSPLSSNAQNPLYKDLYKGFFDGSGDGATYGGIPPSGNGSDQLPNYPGIAALSAVPASLPGGYWNQRALHDAALTYGPFAGFAQHPLPIAPSGILGT